VDSWVAGMRRGRGGVGEAHPVAVGMRKRAEAARREPWLGWAQLRG